MNITVDTNVLVRLVTDDDPAQHALAAKIVEHAHLIAIGLSSLCEMAWVLNRQYGYDRDDIGDAIRSLSGAAKVVTNRPAVEAGLNLLNAGGDFADGVIAHEGRGLGGDTFVSFDKRAVKLLLDEGLSAERLGQ